MAARDRWLRAAGIISGRLLFSLRYTISIHLHVATAHYRPVSPRTRRVILFDEGDYFSHRSRNGTIPPVLEGLRNTSFLQFNPIK